MPDQAPIGIHRMEIHERPHGAEPPERRVGLDGDVTAVVRCDGAPPLRAQQADGRVADGQGSDE